MSTIIGACGYTATGSGAVLDLLKEFDEVQVIDVIEFQLTYYPDGLEDLDWKLNQKISKQGYSTAIMRFRRLMNSKAFLHRMGFSKKAKLRTITNDFISKITQVSYKSIICRGYDFELYIRTGLKIFFKQLKNFLRLKKVPNLYYALANRQVELAVRPSNFDEAAKEYVHEILKILGMKEDKIIALDQPFSGNNPESAFKYFDNPKAIVVNNDPRDYYLNNKIFYKSIGVSLGVPTDNVEDFIKFYKLMRIEPNGIRNNNNILYMNFEELVYDYDNAINKIANFCCISNHVHKKKNFNPHWSRNNTQLFKKYKGFEDDIKRIESELSEYCFPFDEFPDVKSEGNAFYDRMPNTKEQKV